MHSLELLLESKVSSITLDSSVVIILIAASPLTVEAFPVDAMVAASAKLRHAHTLGQRMSSMLNSLDEDCVNCCKPLLLTSCHMMSDLKFFDGMALCMFAFYDQLLIIWATMCKGLEWFGRRWFGYVIPPTPKCLHAMTQSRRIPSYLDEGLGSWHIVDETQPGDQI